MLLNKFEHLKNKCFVFDISYFKEMTNMFNSFSN